MGQLRYGSGDGGTNINLPDETLVVLDEAIRERFVVGDHAGRPFRIWISGRSGGLGVQLYMSAGIPLQVRYDREIPPEEFTDEMRELMRQTLKGLDDDGTLYIPGVITG